VRRQRFGSLKDVCSSGVSHYRGSTAWARGRRVVHDCSHLSRRTAKCCRREWARVAAGPDDPQKRTGRGRLSRSRPYRTDRSVASTSITAFDTYAPNVTPRRCDLGHSDVNEAHPNAIDRRIGRGTSEKGNASTIGTRRTICCEVRRAGFDGFVFAGCGEQPGTYEAGSRFSPGEDGDWLVISVSVTYFARRSEARRVQLRYATRRTCYLRLRQAGGEPGWKND